MVRASPRFFDKEKMKYNKPQVLSRPWTPKEVARGKKKALKERNKRREEKRKETIAEATNFLENQKNQLELMICCNNSELSKSLERISCILEKQGSKEISKSEILRNLLGKEEWHDVGFVYTSILEFLKSFWKFYLEYEQYCCRKDGEAWFTDPFGVTYRDPPYKRRDFLKDNKLPVDEGVVRNLEKNVLRTTAGNELLSPSTLNELSKKRDDFYMMSKCLNVALSSLVKGEVYKYVGEAK